MRWNPHNIKLTTVFYFVVLFYFILKWKWVYLERYTFHRQNVVCLKRQEWPQGMESSGKLRAALGETHSTNKSGPSQKAKAVPKYGMKINHFKVNNSKAFSAFTVYNHHIYRLAKHFHPKGDPVHKQSLSTPPSL